MMPVLVYLCCLLVGGQLCIYLCLQLGGILCGCVCNKLELSSWFRIRIYVSWKPALSFEIHVYDLTLGDKIIRYLTEKLSFHLPLRCKDLTVAYFRMKWVLVGPDRSLLPRLHLDGVVVKIQVTSLVDWNTPSSSHLYSPGVPLSSSSSSSSSSFPSISPYEHIAWMKKHQLANHLSLLVEHYLREAAAGAVVVSPLQPLTVYKDALIANLHISLCNLELR